MEQPGYAIAYCGKDEDRLDPQQEQNEVCGIPCGISRYNMRVLEYLFWSREDAQKYIDAGMNPTYRWEIIDLNTTTRGH